MHLQMGDWIETEAQCSGAPRWSGSIDYGGCGRWLRGKVIEVTRAHALVRLPCGIWHVPLPEHSDYALAQWARPGFLRRAG